jgi:NADH-quinone oxidoreductase subunit C
MADETKVPPPGGGSEPPAKPAPVAGAPASIPAQSAGAPPKPAAAAPAKPAAPAAPKAPIKPDPWSSPMLDELQKKFLGAISEAVIFRNMPSLIVAKESLIAMCEFLKSPEGGEYSLLTDHTAVDYPKREKRFELIYHIYSFKKNERLRLKVLAGENEKVPSVTGVWPTANWLEREVFDMFGVQYEGHPDLKRILMPDEWTGHPLRKDYDILRQDENWVQANLGIKSAQ